MYSKTKWITKLGPVGLLLVTIATPLTGQTIKIPAMRFAFMEGEDEARELFKQGAFALDAGQYAKAIEIFRKVLEKYPKNRIADRSCFYLISTLEKTGKVNDALAQITVFEKAYPKSSWMNDVREVQVRITRQAPEEVIRSLSAASVATAQTAAQTRSSRTAPAAPPAPPPPAPPAPPAPPRAMVLARGQRGAANQNPEVSLQQEVLRVLFENNPDSAIQIATDRLKADPTDPVALSSLNMVANSKSDKALPMLVTLAKSSPDMRARRDAIYWISRSRGEKDALTDVLVGLVPSMVGDEDSTAIAFALGQLNTPKAFEALASMARDKGKPERLRLEATRSVGDSRLPNRVALLDEIYKGSMDDVRIRRQVAASLSHGKEPQAVSVLSAIVSSDPDQNLKLSAVSYLGQIQTPEAQKALEDLLARKKP